MSIGEESGHEHPTRTRRNGYRYFFYAKHHGRGGSSASQWLTEVSEDQEFSIFDEADRLELTDEAGNLFGAERSNAGGIRIIGTLGQQVAKFPITRTNEPWHGYPLYPLDDLSPTGPPRRGIPVTVLQKMVEQSILTEQQFRRLRKGRHA